MKPGLQGIEIDSDDLPPGHLHRAVDRQPDARDDARQPAVVILVLFAFLYEWRAALISVVAIPLSLMSAGLVLYFYGATINTMILAGFVIALGEVVDDAIIDIENIMRRLRENRRRSRPRSTAAIILSASLEIRSAVVYATLIIVLAISPVFFMTGLSGAFFRPLASAYALALLASMVVALTDHAGAEPDPAVAGAGRATRIAARRLAAARLRHGAVAAHRVAAHGHRPRSARRCAAGRRRSCPCSGNPCCRNSRSGTS